MVREVVVPRTGDTGLAAVELVIVKLPWRSRAVGTVSSTNPLGRSSWIFSA